MTVTILGTVPSKANKRFAIKEESLHIQVATYLKYQYPDVIFRSDFAAGIKMTMGQAVKHKRMQHGKSYPDLFIAEPRNGFSGMYLELKKDFSEVYKKDGSLRDIEHIQEQQKMLWTLQKKGFVAVFACGFNDAKSLIDEYLK